MAEPWTPRERDFEAERESSALPSEPTAQHPLQLPARREETAASAPVAAAALDEAAVESDPLSAALLQGGDGDDPLGALDRRRAKPADLAPFSLPAQAAKPKPAQAGAAAPLPLHVPNLTRLGQRALLSAQRYTKMPR